MRRFDTRVIGIDRGSLLLFSDFKDNGKMWAGEGHRQHRREIRFSEPFRAPPVVSVTMSMWDMDSESNQRAEIATDDITEAGFAIVFKTWGDTRIARVRAEWMAIGALPDEDVWDVD